MSVLNPKVSLLQKLAQILALVPGTENDAWIKLSSLMIDPEVVEWLARMTELKYVQKGFQDEKRSVETPGFHSGDSHRPNNNVSSNSMRVGYQLCATIHAEGKLSYDEDEATYAECESHQAALKRCYEEFKPEDGYSNHHVKVIDTGEIIYPGRARQAEGRAKPAGLSLDEPDGPPEPVTWDLEPGVTACLDCGAVIHTPDNIVPGKFIEAHTGHHLSTTINKAEELGLKL